MFNSPECVPHQKPKSLLEVPREIILNFPDSETLKLQVYGGCQTPTSCTFPQTLPRPVEHYSNLPLYAKPLQALALFFFLYEPGASFLLSMNLQMPS